MGVGGKRFRGVTGGTSTRSVRAPGPTAAPSHDASLGDEVQAARDPEFAAEKRDAKRRKVAEAATAQAARRPRGGKNSRRATAPADADADDVETGEALRVEAVDARLSAKILGEARKQREEVREDALAGIAEVAAGRARAIEAQRKLGGEKGGDNDEGGGSDDSDFTDEDRDGENDSQDCDPEDIVGVEGMYGAELTEADRLAVAMFSGDIGDDDDEGDEGSGVDCADGGSGSGLFGGGRLMLADVILAKIREKADNDAAASAAAANPEMAAREQKIAEVYGLVGNIMARYKSGRIPKAFKVIPKLQNWEHLMHLTRPDEWSPAATYAATRLFASNLTAKEVVCFYRDVLLPRVLQDISENKKLNYHLFRALKKALYKPDAFNKGILFPMCEAGGCSLREATIIGGVLANVSIPMLHSAAALLFIAKTPYALSNSVFIHTLLNKKYALPYRVIDALVVHFTCMKSETRIMPLVWHISLLTFARRYKTEMEAMQKDELKLLLRVQTHGKITPEIRRELFSARCRGEVGEPDANTIARAIASA
jgi:essential nuclear protein 1